MTDIRFDGQVAIVTGGGGSIGLAIARALASRGARILLNDYGGDTQGRAGTIERAEQAAAELRQLGAEAVADGTPVGTAEAARAIVSHAMQAFGRVDILVNNAGVALPGFITDHSDEALENLFRINFAGPYALVRAVWPVMKTQRHGRILSTSSNSAFGIGHNAPYSATKAGLIGLTLDAAIEGQPDGILVNAMMPTAMSRMIEQIPDPNFVDWFRHHFPARTVAASVLPLLSRASSVTGRIYAVGGGRIARVAFAEGRGWAMPGLAPEDVLPHQAKIEDMTHAIILDNQAQEMALYTELHPFDGPGSPALDESAIRGAGQGGQHA